MKANKKIDTLMPLGILKQFTHIHTQVLNNHDMPVRYIMIMPDNIKWPVTPLGMPPGYQQSMIEGNPRVAELFTFRAKIPANWKAMPHFHPADEYITVLDGACYMGIGEKYDEKKAAEMPTGAFSVMKAGTAHYFFTKQACIIQVHGKGPQKITYVNPSDDPRNKSIPSNEA